MIAQTKHYKCKKCGRSTHGSTTSLRVKNELCVSCYNENRVGYIVEAFKPIRDAQREQLIIDGYVQAFGAVFADDNLKDTTRDDKQYICSFVSWDGRSIHVFSNLETLDTEEIAEV